MIEHAPISGEPLPAGSLVGLPASWPVLATRPTGDDRVVDLTGRSGEVVSQIVLLCDRTHR